MNDYEQLAQKPLGDNILAQIAATARDILEAREEVSRREEALKEAQNRLKGLQEDILPS
jgi:peptidoglycan hydrolase CwlO-like protein